MADIENTTYIPVLAVRPAEMNALRELPERDKDLMLPAIQLRPWLGANEFTSAIKKVEEVFGKERKWIANLDCGYEPPNVGVDLETGDVRESRPAIVAFEALCDPTNGYENWCSFVEENGNIIPCIQLEDISQFATQVDRLSALQRGLVLQISSPGQLPSDAQLNYLNSTAQDNQVLFIIDCGELTHREDLSHVIARWVDNINRVYGIIPGCFVAISSTSFPQTFDSITTQEIKERQLYNIALTTGQTRGWNLIYSDRASVRLHIPRSGGGIPYPRIDYPTAHTWYFFRSEADKEYLSEARNREAEYQSMARAALGSNYWNQNLRIWGTQMIERTARGDEFGITSPARATAVRINIHLHQQLFYNNPADLLNTDDDWVD